jgi:hypothetical protein
MIKLFSFKKTDDYSFGFLSTSRGTLVQFSFGYDTNIAWPYLQISMGGNQLFSFFCYFWKVCFAIDLLGHTWPDLE